jgi:hypothetical protein
MWTCWSGGSRASGKGWKYAQDAIAAGMKKALIVLGHVISEENGMSECARWLKTFVTEVPVEARRRAVLDSSVRGVWDAVSAR